MNFSFFVRIVLKLIRLPAVIKGACFASDAFIGPGYDFLFTQWRGVKVCSGVLIGKRAWIQVCSQRQKPEIIIGNGTHIGRNVVISCNKKISIGSGCLFSYNVSLIDHDHLFEQDISSTKLGITDGEDIIIGNNCFVGAHVFILKGVVLGDGCVVGSNSVVTRSFPANTMIAGSPAREISKNVSFV